MRKLITIIAISVVALVSVGTAYAGVQNSSYSLSVLPQTTFVANGQNVTVNFTATNKTTSDATCYLHVEETDFSSLDFVLNANNYASGQLSTPANAKNGRLTFDLVCNGTIVAKNSVNVKVR